MAIQTARAVSLDQSRREPDVIAFIVAPNGTWDPLHGLETRAVKLAA